MSHDPTYHDIVCSLLPLECLAMELDFAMWLHCEYGGKSNKLVSLVVEPRKALDVEIDKRLEHGGSPWALMCSQCGTMYGSDSKQPSSCFNRPAKCLNVTFPSWKIGAGMAIQDVGKLQAEQCGCIAFSRLLVGKSADARESIEMQLAEIGNLAATRMTVSTWLTDPLPDGGDVQYSLSETLDHLKVKVEEDVDQLTYRLASVKGPLLLAGRRDILPQGSGVAEKLQDYLEVRDKLISQYVWVHGIAKTFPEFEELKEVRSRPRQFPPSSQIQPNRSRPERERSHVIKRC